MCLIKWSLFCEEQGGCLPSVSWQTPVLLQAVLPWHFVWKLYGIKDVRTSTANMESGRNCIFFFMGWFYLMNQDITMQWIFSGELSGYLTLSGCSSQYVLLLHPGKTVKSWHSLFNYFCLCVGLFTVEGSMKNEPLFYGSVSSHRVQCILYELIYVVLWRCLFVCLIVCLF